MFSCSGDGTSKKKRTLSVASILILIAIPAISSLLVSFGLYMASYYGGAIKTQMHFYTGSPTMWPTTSVTPLPTKDNHGIKSIEFNLTDPRMAVIIDNKMSYYATNIGTANLEIRKQYTLPSGTFVTIISGEEKNAWIYRNGEWSQSPQNYANLDQEPIQSIVDAIAANWTGQGRNFTFTFDSNSEPFNVTLTDIVINPSLPESLFQPGN